MVSALSSAHFAVVSVVRTQLGEQAQPEHANAVEPAERAEHEDEVGYPLQRRAAPGFFNWVAKGDPVGQRQFIHTIFGVAA